MKIRWRCSKCRKILYPIIRYSHSKGRNEIAVWCKRCNYWMHLIKR